MRTSEERVKELHRRVDALEQKRTARKYRIRSTAVYAVCLAAVFLIAFAVAGAAIQEPAMQPSGISASIFSDHAELGYVVVALLSFCLGAFVTVFCFRLRKHMEDKDNDRKH